MTEWGWVLLGFGTAYGSIAAYLLSLRVRALRARRRLEALR